MFQLINYVETQTHWNRHLVLQHKPESIFDLLLIIFLQREIISCKYKTDMKKSPINVVIRMRPTSNFAHQQMTID
jgi:hypothetical protein